MPAPVPGCFFFRFLIFKLLYFPCLYAFTRIINPVRLGSFASFVFFIIVSPELRITPDINYGTWLHEWFKWVKKLFLKSTTIGKKEPWNPVGIWEVNSLNALLPSRCYRLKKKPKTKRNPFVHLVTPLILCLIYLKFLKKLKIFGYVWKRWRHKEDLRI